MTIEEILKLISNTGIAVFLVIWGILRLDKFLSHMAKKQDVFYGELTNINSSIDKLCACIKENCKKD